MREAINIVWYKRDLRTQDHAPLLLATEAGLPTLLLYIFDEDIVTYKDMSPRHHRFVYQSIMEMNQNLEITGHQIHYCYGKSATIFQAICQEFDVKQVFSYQESGPQHTWEVDKQVAEVLKEYKVKWTELEKDGVVRGLQSRSGWEDHWYDYIGKPIIENDYSWQGVRWKRVDFELPVNFLEMISVKNADMQPGGERAGWNYLHSFATERGRNYQRHISKPEYSRKSSSRLSPYIAWGNLSVRQIFHYVRFHPNYENHKRAFRAFLIRLQWRSHFIQKFEVECSYETVCVNKGYELLEHEKKEDFIKAWQTGNTGYPLVDACMRALIQTGWINFRMRSMLVSFFCHHLDQDWRDGVYHIARLFLDYEPGIHFTQFQMQAGTTGVNTVRIYNPVKQSKDHDPKGRFIRTWVPELCECPDEFIHEPWTMTSFEQEMYDFKLGEKYPEPLVQLEESGRRARTKIWGHRKNKAVQEEKKRILAVHVKPGKSNGAS
ncbi:MAG: DNA photolyase family protein [bacterium]|nr:DNA photolyase family protein [bacterium]